MVKDDVLKLTIFLFWAGVGTNRLRVNILEGWGWGGAKKTSFFGKVAVEHFLTFISFS